MPYCHLLPFMESHQWEKHTVHYDFRSDDWKEWVDYVVRSHCGELAQDPSLIGYFYSDCPTWAHDRPGNKWRGPLFDPERLKSEAGRRELTELAHAYYKTTHDAIRRYDKNHLILGDRYEANAPIPMEVVNAALPYIDVLSFQDFRDPIKHLDEWYKKTGKTVLLADAAGLRVPARADGFKSNNGKWHAETLHALHKNPGCIGFHLCGAYQRNKAHKKFPSMPIIHTVQRIFGLSCLASPLALMGNAEPLPTAIPEFIEQHCADCHDDIEKKGDLDLWSLAEQPITPDTLHFWIHAYDRAQAGEMPKKKKRRPEPSHLDEFLDLLADEIIDAEKRAQATIGRSVKHRLNRYEYENSIRDLLSLPYLEIKESLPEDPMLYGYNKIGEALDVSHVQLSRYLRTAESALREAVVPVLEKPDASPIRYYSWQQPGMRKIAGPAIRKTHPVVGLELRPDLVGNAANGKWYRPNVGEYSDPERKDEEAVLLVASSYEPTDLQFNQFRAPVSGPYRIKFSGYTIWMSPKFDKVTRGRRSEPVTIYADTTPRILRRMGSFDFGPDPSVQEMTVWLKAGETIRPDATRLVRPRPPEYKNPLLEEDGMPGVAFLWMEVEGPLYDSWPPPGYKLLFGDLDLAVIEKEKSDKAFDPEKHLYDPDDPAQDIAELLMNDIFADRGEVVVHSDTPAQDAERLLNNFIQKAYRYPVSADDLKGFLNLILDALAVAERLSYFLWNSAPDDDLLALAENGKILKPKIKRNQVERLLADPKSRRFVDAFLDYWLDLRHMSDSSPDGELYPEYQLDDALVESIPEETQLYFHQLIHEDRSIAHLVDSDFLILNERLAKHYEIDNVIGAHFRPVALDELSPRGGLMTQASVLKVTANGTTSSPITRGAWIMERILGHHIPPPPASVQAIESDIRGAKTIREQLALHRSQESCNTCHVKIDPAGFALENFDVMGGWRDYYRTTSKGDGDKAEGIGHDGYQFRYRIGLPVDASGQLPDGRGFHDIRELKELLLADEPQLARNLVEQFVIYATGAPIHFSDRTIIDSILENSRGNHFGLRTLIHEVVKSDLFLNK